MEDVDALDTEARKGLRFLDIPARSSVMLFGGVDGLELEPPNSGLTVVRVGCRGSWWQ